MNIRIGVFISHSWAYSEHYEKLEKWIWDGDWSVEGRDIIIEFANYSIPQSDPIHNVDNDEELQIAIDDRIIKSDVIIIPMGMYTNYSKWIQKEIDSAKVFNKPILAVDPWAQKRSSSVVRDNSTKAVGWNKKSVVQGIFDLYRS